MPLPEPKAPREAMHTRTITCRGYRRNDGLWDIEGRITDGKHYSFENDHRGQLHDGDFIHDMSIRLTLSDALEVVDVETVSEATPYATCPAITPAFKKLVGLSIRPGWNAKVKELLGGVRGCTHIVDLLGPVATTAFQTIMPVLARERREKAARDGGEADAPNTAPATARLINSCHALASNGEVVRRYFPEHFTGDEKLPKA